MKKLTTITEVTSVEFNNQDLRDILEIKGFIKRGETCAVRAGVLNGGDAVGISITRTSSNPTPSLLPYGCNLLTALEYHIRNAKCTCTHNPGSEVCRDCHEVKLAIAAMADWNEITKTL